VRESSPLELQAADVQAMRMIGAALARALESVDAPFVIAFDGELGAGKTTLVGALLNALGFAGHARSPTYTLIEPYEIAGRAVYHLDLYRLTDPREVDALGLRDLQEQRSLFLIEWPERGKGALPPADLTVSIRYAEGGGRSLRLTAGSNSGAHVLLACAAAAKP
jgi:tRNA threonylcarbamoyladenosine biosynthesis protein TsaE